MRACMRACVHACVRACVRACVWGRAEGELPQHPASGAKAAAQHTQHIELHATIVGCTQVPSLKGGVGLKRARVHKVFWVTAHIAL